MAGTVSALQLNPSPAADPLPPLQVLVPSPSPVLRNCYKVEYARFFSFSHPPERNVEHPKLLRRKRTRPSDGTWFSSSSASLQLFCCDTSGSESPSQLVLVISVRSKILEEHYISKLHFSWPQMSCVSQYQMRGSRVVFASYRNSAGQAEKFAIRFSNNSQSFSFIDLLKGSLTNVREVGMQQSSSMQSEYQPVIEFAKSDEMNHSDLSIVPSINDGMQQVSSEQATLPDEYGDYTPLPPSFTDLLAESRSGAQETAASNPIDFMSQITKYMTSPSFKEMLGMVEKVINDMEGDLDL